MSLEWTGAVTGQERGMAREETQFKKGRPRLPGAGRTRGTPNKITAQVAALARALTLEDQQVIDAYRRKAEAGRLPPQVFIELLHYGYGKPVERVEMFVPDPIIIQHSS
jgi:hypothetical protein